MLTPPPPAYLVQAPLGVVLEQDGVTGPAVVIPILYRSSCFSLRSGFPRKCVHLQLDLPSRHGHAPAVRASRHATDRAMEAT